MIVFVLNIRVNDLTENALYMKIEDQVIVITGGTKGLGLALASSFAKKGNKVIVASRSLDFRKKINNDYLFVKANVANEVEVKELANVAIKKFRRINIWINNAGIWLPHCPIEKINIKRVHDLIEINMFGTIYGSKYALMQMRKQGGGIIVNILSSSALDGGVGSSGYCSSKFAASGFTKCLRLETASDGIKVVSVYSRGMKTNFFDEKKPKNYNFFMDPAYVAEKIITNLESKHAKQDLIINK
jgi:short-subunit dehydrogenase